MKLVKKISLLIVLLVLFSSIIYYRLTFNRTEKFIDYNAAIILKINDAKKFLFNDKNKQFYNFILTQKNSREYFEVLSDMRIGLDLLNHRLINFLNGSCDIAFFNENKVVVAFNYNFKGILVDAFLHIAEKYFSDSTYFKLSSYYTNNRKIYILYSKKIKREFFLCMHKNILLFSTEKKLIETNPKSILSDDDYNYVNANLESNNNLRIFFNLKNMKSKNKIFDNRLFNIKYIGLYVDTFKTFSKIEGFASIDFYSKTFYNLLVPFNDVSTILNFMPLDTNNFFAVKFKNAKLFYKYLIKRFIIKNKKEFNDSIKNIENYLGMGINDFLYSWLGDEIIIADFKNSNIHNKLFFLKIKNYDKLRKVLTFKESRYLSNPNIDIYMKHKIYQLNLNLFYKTLKFIFNKKINMPYFIIFNNYFVLSYNKHLLKNLLKKYENEDILLYSDLRITDSLKMYQYDRMFFYWYFNSKTLRNFHFINNIYEKGLFGISKKLDGIKFNISLFYADKIKPMLLPYWPISVRYKILDPPVLTKLYDPDKYRILSIDRTAVVRVFDIYGTKIATVDMNRYKRKIKKVLGMIYDYKIKEYVLLLILKNNTIIKFLMHSRKEVLIRSDKEFKNILFDVNTHNFIYYNKNNVLIRDFYGNDISAFNMPYEKKIKFLKYFYDKNNTAFIFFIVTEDNFVIKLKFKNNKFQELFAYKNRFRVDYLLNKNFGSEGNIVLISRSGSINLINLKGEKLKFKTRKVYDRFQNIPVIAKIFNKQKLVLFSVTKKMYIFNERGELERVKRMDFKIKRNSVINTVDLNNDGTDEFVFLLKNKKIFITNKDTEIIYKIAGNNLPLIKDINNDGIKELIINRRNKIYVYMLLKD